MYCISVPEALALANRELSFCLGHGTQGVTLSWEREDWKTLPICMCLRNGCCFWASHPPVSLILYWVKLQLLIHHMPV